MLSLEPLDCASFATVLVPHQQARFVNCESTVHHDVRITSSCRCGGRITNHQLRCVSFLSQKSRIVNPVRPFFGIGSDIRDMMIKLGIRDSP